MNCVGDASYFLAALGLMALVIGTTVFILEQVGTGYTLEVEKYCAQPAEERSPLNDGLLIDCEGIDSCGSVYVDLVL